MPLKLNLNIPNKAVYAFIPFIVLLAVVGFVWAYNPGGAGGVPAVMGHSVDEMDWSRPVPGNLLVNGNVGIGTTSPTAKLEVAGQVKITGGSPEAGKTLISDSSGLSSWEFTPAIRMCNSINTISPMKKFKGWPSSEWTTTKGYDWKGYDTISMLIDGRNICEDDDGCTYRIWAYTAGKPAGAYFYTMYPVIFRQINTHNWHDARGDQTGINGDGIETPIFNDWHNLYMRDDWASAPGGENSPDELTIRDNSDTYAFLITICDH